MSDCALFILILVLGRTKVKDDLFSGNYIEISSFSSKKIEWKKHHNHGLWKYHHQDQRYQHINNLKNMNNSLPEGYYDGFGLHLLFAVYCVQQVLLLIPFPKCTPNRMDRVDGEWVNVKWCLIYWGSSGRKVDWITILLAFFLSVWYLLLVVKS